MVVCQGIVASTASSLHHAWSTSTHAGLWKLLQGCPGPLTMVQVR